MTPAARVQAAIEVLDLVIAAARADGASADRILAEWFRSRRYAGSKDRRAVRDLVFRAIRACGDIPASGRAAMLRLTHEDGELAELFDGSRYGPAAVAPDEEIAAAGIAPGWLEERLSASGLAGADAEALLARAPLDIRVNRLKADRATISLPIAGEHTAAPQGLRFAPGTPVEQWPAWSEGLIEVQDTGSQLVSLALAAGPDEAVIDLCAGAGGKTLALAADMDNRGRLLACDSDRGRLSRLAPRALRAGAGMIETLLLDPGKEMAALESWVGRADAVLVDAPCSGSGTWRRNPEARWRLTPARLVRVEGLQARLLDLAAQLVRPGGRLIYAVCSLFDSEGCEQIAAFLDRNADWSATPPNLPTGETRGPGIRLSPSRDGTDGFFIACLDRLC